MDDIPKFDPSKAAIEDFDPEFASPAQWAKMYRACGLQVVPGYMPGEPKNGSWKRPGCRNGKSSRSTSSQTPSSTFYTDPTANTPGAHRWGS